MAERHELIKITADELQWRLLSRTTIGEESRLVDLGATSDIEVYSLPVEVFRRLCVALEIPRTPQMEKAFLDAFERRRPTVESCLKWPVGPAAFNPSVAEIVDAFDEASSEVRAGVVAVCGIGMGESKEC